MSTEYAELIENFVKQYEKYLNLNGDYIENLLKYVVKNVCSVNISTHFKIKL